MNIKVIMKILVPITSVISACCVLFFLSLSVFNVCLLNNLSSALPIVESYGKGKIPEQVLSSYNNDELMFFNGDPEGCRQYTEETKTFLFYLLTMLTFSAFIFCVSLYLRKNLKHSAD